MHTGAMLVFCAEWIESVKLCLVSSMVRELRVEVVHHKESADPYRKSHEEVENEGLIAGRLFMSIRKWP